MYEEFIFGKMTAETAQYKKRLKETIFKIYR